MAYAHIRHFPTGRPHFLAGATHQVEGGFRPPKKASDLHSALSNPIAQFRLGPDDVARYLVYSKVDNRKLDPLNEGLSPNARRPNQRRRGGPHAPAQLPPHTLAEHRRLGREPPQKPRPAGRRPSHHRRDVLPLIPLTAPADPVLLQRDELQRNSPLARCRARAGAWPTTG